MLGLAFKVETDGVEWQQKRGGYFKALLNLDEMAKSTESFKLFRQSHSSLGTEGKASCPVSLYFCLTLHHPSPPPPALLSPPFKSLSISKVLDYLKYLNSTYLSTLINSDIWVRKYVVMFLRYRVSKELYLVRKFLKDVECPVVQGWYKEQKIVLVAEAWK